MKCVKLTLNSHDLMIQLFVNNEKEEFICSIKSETNNIPNKLVVNTYSRDSHVLKNKRTFQIRPATDVDVKKFLGFGKYLLERGKAAAINLDLNRVLYLLPPRKSDSPSFETLQAAIFRSGVLEEGTSGETNKLVVKEGSNPTASSGGLLSSLLAKAEETVKTREPGTYSKPATENRAQATEKRVRTRIEAFIAANQALDLGQWQGLDDEDGEWGAASASTIGKVLVFEPMDKDLRFIIHELVETEFSSQLVSISAGDDEERHVEVYIRGYEPLPEPDAPGDGGLQIRSVKRPRSGGGVPEAVRPSLGSEQLVRVGQLKRDRRTIEEIQQGLKKRKEPEE